jgi:DNA-binding NarL/FixJ family response regulator
MNTLSMASLANTKSAFTEIMNKPDPLSVRELEVLQLVARGALNQEIAQTRVILIDTVKHHYNVIPSGPWGMALSLLCWIHRSDCCS